MSFDVKRLEGLVRDYFAGAGTRTVLEVFTASESLIVATVSRTGDVGRGLYGRLARTHREIELGGDSIWDQARRFCRELEAQLQRGPLAEPRAVRNPTTLGPWLDEVYAYPWPEDQEPRS